MIISTLNENHYIDAFGIRCQLLNPQSDISKHAINTTHCIVSPKKQTLAHGHREVEQFFIISGTGKLTLENKKYNVSAGQLVTIPPYQNHSIKNTSESNDLVFLSSYSDFLQIAQKNHYQSVIAAPPTPNGDLHLGHLGGPYLASDIYKRYLGLRNLNVLSLSGTDDHQNYIARAAKNKGQREKEVSSYNRNLIKESLSKANIKYDDFLNPSEDPNYKSFVSSFYSHLLNKEIFETRAIKTFFSLKTGNAVLESEIVGDCPSCGESVVGNCCESCGNVCDVSMLINSLHIDGEEIESKMVERVVLDLNRCADVYEEYCIGNGVDDILIGKFREMMKVSEFYPVTYPGEWGVQTENSQVINVWVEMAASYVYQSQTSGRPFFSGDDSTASLFCGEDNLFYYMVLIPILLRFYDEKNKTPYRIYSNKFLLLEGQKFSTSKKHAVWVNDYLENNDSDYLRYFLAYNRSTYKEENIELQKIEETTEITHLSKIDDLIEALKVEKCAKDEVFSESLVSELSDYIVSYERNFTSKDLGLRKNAALISSLIARSLELYHQYKIGLIDLSNFALSMRVLGMLILPFMPKRGEKIISLFKENKADYWIQDLSIGLSKELLEGLKQQMRGQNEQ